MHKHWTWHCCTDFAIILEVTITEGFSRPGPYVPCPINGQLDPGKTSHVKFPKSALDPAHLQYSGVVRKLLNFVGP